MIFKAILALSALASFGAAAPLEARAAPGQAIVHNQCSFPVNLWSVGSANYAAAAHALAPGATYAELYRTPPNGGGVSLKIGRGDNLYTQPVEQFEYTLGPGPRLWYDLSLINGDPFAGEKLLLRPSRPVGPSCVDVANDGAYRKPDDDWATHACESVGVDLTLTLCA